MDETPKHRHQQQQPTTSASNSTSSTSTFLLTTLHTQYMFGPWPLVEHFCSRLARLSRPTLLFQRDTHPSQLYQLVPRQRRTGHRFFSSNPVSYNMSGLSAELTAPNGRKYTQPLGLFINNEFVAAKSGQTIVSVNPTYEPCFKPLERII